MASSRGNISTALIGLLEERRCIVTAGSPPKSELANHIYPMFSARSFPDLKKKEHAWVDPALRLASHFLTEESLSAFWTRLHHGKLAQEWRDGEEVQYICPVVEADNVKEKLRTKKKTQGALGKIARGLKVVALPKNMSCTDTEVFGKPYLVGKGSDASSYRIALDPDVIRYIQVQASKNDGTLTREEGCQNLRFQFLLAHGLVRSAVRLFYLHTHEDSMLDTQPYFELEEAHLEIDADLSASWEMFALGCTLLQWKLPPHMSRKDGVKPIDPPPKTEKALSLFLHTPRTVETGLDTMYEHTTVVPMAWIFAWFKQSTWDAIHKDNVQTGRPRLGRAPILVKKDGGETSDPGAEWKMERFDHEELLAHGGFNTTDEKQQAWIFGDI